MTKAVHGQLPAGVHINETDLAVLDQIGSRSGGSGSAVELSLRELSALTARKVETVRRSCRQLERQGLIDVESRYLPNGGQLENAYAITAKGCQVLVGARHAQ